MKKFLLNIFFFSSLLALLIPITTNTASAQNATPDTTDTIKTTSVGDMQLSLLSEGNSSGKAEIIVNASEEELEKYLPDGKFMAAVNAFLIVSENKKILVDTGFGRELFNNLEKLGYKPEDIDVVLLTHMHGDHITGLLRNGKPAFVNADIYVAEKELAYWQDKPAAQTLAPYKDKIRTFNPESLESGGLALFPGIYAIAAYGHTPGHTAFMLQSKGQSAMLWGDITHVTPIQIPSPEVFVTYDVDSQQAIKTRQQILAYLVDKDIIVAAAHIEIPGMGYIKSTEKSGSYNFVFVE